MSECTIHVSKISPLLEEAHLKELFECCGQIESLKLGGLGDEKTCTIVFATEDGAKAAVLLSGTPLGDRPLQVDPDSHSSTTAQLAQAARGPTDEDAPQEYHGVPTADLDRDYGDEEIPPHILEAQRARREEISRTVYVGNLNPVVMEDHLRQFFSPCGEILFIKLAGSSGQGSHYAFVEFRTQTEANTARNLNGAMLGDRPLKVGAAENPIVKPTTVPTTVSVHRIKTAMEKVREAQKQLQTRYTAEKKSRSPSRSRSRERRDRERKRRSRSRDRDRRRRSRRSRSRSRSRRHRSRSPARRSFPMKRRNPHEGMVWDGFQWTPTAGIEPDKLQNYEPISRH